jgi:cytochrome d ubiquinol oxidase subunit II
VEEMRLFLADIWYVLVGLIIALYVILDGFDLGVGVLSLFSRSERRRAMMMTSLATVWDANEVWLVIAGGSLFGAFPAVYSLLLSALYIPVVLLVVGLIFRGIAFEFRGHSRRRRLWSASFGVGSLVASAAQGCILGGMLGGIRIDRLGRFAGGPFDWATPFTGAIVVGVVAGYAMLGSTYLILKSRGAAQQAARVWAQVSAVLTFGAAAATTIALPFMQVAVGEKWLSSPDRYYLFSISVVSTGAFFMLLHSLRSRHGHELSPFLWSLLIFALALGGLWVGIYPDFIPGTLGVGQAAASAKTLVFMLTGIGFLIPIIIVYNGYMYVVLRGKVGEEETDEDADYNDWD